MTETEAKSLIEGLTEQEKQVLLALLQNIGSAKEDTNHETQ